MDAASAIQEFAGFVAANRDWNDETAIEHLVTKGVSKSEAEDAVRFAPIAFGRLILAGLGVELADEYICFRADGTAERTGKLADNEAFRSAAQLAPSLANRPAFKPLAYSSSEVDGVNQALKAGSDPKDLVLGPVAIFLEPPTKSGFEIAQKRIITLARMAANVDPEKECVQPNRPWWKFW